jgi:hypothetical protein
MLELKNFHKDSAAAGNQHGICIHQIGLPKIRRTSTKNPLAQEIEEGIVMCLRF